MVECGSAGDSDVRQVVLRYVFYSHGLKIEILYNILHFI